MSALDQSPELLRGGRAYRRGSILGLTIAEAFMLIAFALLMLLLLWKVQQETTLEAAETFASLPAEDRMELLALAETQRDGVLERLRATGVLGAENDALLRLVERAAPLDRGAQETLVDLAQEPGALDALGGGIDPREVSDLLDLASQLEDAGISLAELEDLRRFKAQIADSLGAKAAAKSAFVASLRSELGDLVAHIGGTIDEDGAITLPDDLLFARGSSAITPRLAAFLDSACTPWFSILHAASDEIGEVRIEGHASSEWRANTPQSEAYFRNLTLSQERSRAVLEACLRRVDGSATGDWARAHATAAGYSSSRLVLDEEGQEDQARSRRVVFRASVRTDDIVGNLRDQLEARAPAN